MCLTILFFNCFRSFLATDLEPVTTGTSLGNDPVHPSASAFFTCCQTYLCSVETMMS